MIVPKTFCSEVWYISLLLFASNNTEHFKLSWFRCVFHFTEYLLVMHIIHAISQFYLFYCKIILIGVQNIPVLCFFLIKKINCTLPVCFFVWLRHLQKYTQSVSTFVWRINWLWPLKESYPSITSRQWHLFILSKKGKSWGKSVIRRLGRCIGEIPTGLEAAWEARFLEAPVLIRPHIPFWHNRRYENTHIPYSPLPLSLSLTFLLVVIMVLYCFL